MCDSAIRGFGVASLTTWYEPIYSNVIDISTSTEIFKTTCYRAMCSARVKEKEAEVAAAVKALNAAARDRDARVGSHADKS